MSEREQAKSIIDRLPEYKIGNLLSFLQGPSIPVPFRVEQAGL